MHISAIVQFANVRFMKLSLWLAEKVSAHPNSLVTVRRSRPRPRAHMWATPHSIAFFWAGLTPESKPSHCAARPRRAPPVALSAYRWSWIRGRRFDRRGLSDAFAARMERSDIRDNIAIGMGWSRISLRSIRAMLA